MILFFYNVLSQWKVGLHNTELFQTENMVPVSEKGWRNGWISLLIFQIFLLTSCEYKTLDDLFEVDDAKCHDGNVSFMDDVFPILQLRCNENICHGGSFPQGRVFLTSYSGVAAVAEDGRLVGSLLHKPGLVPMPLNEDKLDDCSLEKIIFWVEAGFPDN